MKNTTSKQNVLATIVMVAAAISILGSVSTVQAELNTNDFEYSMYVTDIIPYFTYEGMSNYLSNGDESYEDIDTFRFIIQDTNFYAVYNNDVNGNFVFAGIYENGA